MVGEGANATSITINPTKSWTIGGEWRMAIIRGGGQHEGGFRKNEVKNKKEKVRRVFSCIYPLELLYVPRMYIKP